MKLYGLKTCDTCRKALKMLPDAKFVDVRADDVPSDLLQRAEVQFGASLLNTRSTTWRGLSESERARPPLDLLMDHPTLMKRPLILTGEKLYLGWTAETRAALGVG
ncbi:ArsC/Spx/MgsR family protein [Primorskyibacter sp. S87]|uniref:ArsC/Spx/MgsR family protein n=1 Tax=Primorskyibacter sp. S87 TaxID=3415126 RepID=UPI003C7EC0EB